MKRVLFVCLGNICRSPMAEFIMRAMAAQAGLSQQFRFASAATSSEEIRNGIGNPVYPSAREELKKRGIRCDQKRAVQLKREDYQHYDLLLGMEERNLRDMRCILGGDPAGKVKLLLDYAEAPLTGQNIADPWYTGEFSACAAQIEAGCRGLLESLCKER